MKTDKLSQLWNSQSSELTFENPALIIKRSARQRRSQYIGIAVMAATVIILILYTLRYAGPQWNSFTSGLLMMIGSLSFRILLEFLSLHRKERQLIALDSLAFKKYLKQHYRTRLKVNYVITPLCFAVYIIGFAQLLPYFRMAFSDGFYTYIVVSGIASMAFIAVLIIKRIREEHGFLKLLGEK